MKTHILIILLVALGSFPLAFADDPPPTPTAEPSPRSNCTQQSWNPEMHAFYGNKNGILQKLTDWTAKPAEHRVFIQVTVGKHKGSAIFFERSGNSKGYTVTTWSVGETVNLINVVQALDKAIMDNAGVYCVGEQMKAVLQALGKGSTQTNMADPVSASAAFSHAVKEASDNDTDFIKTVIIFGC